MFGDNVDKGRFDILGHPHRIAADIDMSAVIEPRPKIAAGLAHAMLHVDFLVTVARPGKRQSRQKSGRVHGENFVLVEEIAAAALVAEEQPIAPGRADGLPLV